jgi:hypothetical protein
VAENRQTSIVEEAEDIEEVEEAQEVKERVVGGGRVPKMGREIENLKMCGN